MKSGGMIRRLLPLAVVLALLAVPLLAGTAFGQGAQVSVSAVDFQFQPKTITVTAGDTVVWTNNGSVQHTVTADDNSFDSGLLNPGQTFSQTFSSPGTIPYHCSIHGAAGGIGMAGTIIVQAAAVAPQPTQAPAPTEVPTQVVPPTEIPTEVAGATPEAVPTEVPTETPVPAVVPTETPAPTVAPTETPVPAQVAGATPQVAAATPVALPSAGEGNDSSSLMVLAALGLLLVGGGLVAKNRPFGGR